MRLLPIIFIGVLILALTSAVPVEEEAQGWFSRWSPLIRKVLGATERDDEMTLPGLAIRRVRDLLVQYGPASGTGRTSRVLKDNSSYTVVAFLDDLESTWEGYVDHVNSTSGRSGRTLFGGFKGFDYKWLIHHNKFNNKVQSKVNSLLSGPESESLAVGGGIAAGVMGAVGLGLLLSNLKVVKRIDTEGRSGRYLDNWEVTNEIDDTVPVMTSLKSAWSRFDEVNKGRTVGEKFDTVYYKIKEFFGQHKLFNRLDSLYRSPAVNPASVYGGVGAGLIGALGLSFLLAGVKDTHKARSRGRALDIDSTDNVTEVPDYVLNGIDGIWSTFVAELNATAAKVNETEQSVNATQGRRARLFENESDDRSFNKIKMPVALTNWIQKNALNTKITDKLGVLYKAKSPLALAGGATAAAVGISGIGLLIAALAKADKYYGSDYAEEYDNQYDPTLYAQQDVPQQASFSQQPSYVIQPAGAKQSFAQPQQQQGFFQQQNFAQQQQQSQGFFPNQQLPLQSQNAFEKQDRQPVKKHVQTTTTPAPITDQQLDLLRNAIVKIQEGVCSQAFLCQTLAGDQPQLAQLAYLAASYDDQLGAFRPSVRAMLDNAKRRDCTAYKC